MNARQGQLTATEICDRFPVSPQAISQHLKVLREANLVQVEKRAQQRIYRMDPDAMLEMEEWARRLRDLWSQRFDAPRDLVWKVITDPDLVPEWWGPRYLATTVDKMEVKVGGVWRYVQKDPQGKEFAFNGVYQEIVPPERITYTFEFEPMAGHISTETLILEELPGGKTKVTNFTTFDTLEDLEGMLQSGMEGGAVETWDRLEELLVKA